MCFTRSGRNLWKIMLNTWDCYAPFPWSCLSVGNLEGSCSKTAALVTRRLWLLDIHYHSRTSHILQVYPTGGSQVCSVSNLKILLFSCKQLCKMLARKMHVCQKMFRRNDELYLCRYSVIFMYKYLPKLQNELCTKE